MAHIVCSVADADRNQLHEACCAMDMWGQRGSSLLPVELTRELLHLLLPLANGVGGSAASTASEHERRLALGCSIQRLINGFADANQRREYASSVMTLASRLQLPRALVDTRHEVAHGALPSLAALERAGASALRWLVSMFWAPQLSNLQSTRPWLLWDRASASASTSPLPSSAAALPTSASAPASPALGFFGSASVCSACASATDSVAYAMLASGGTATSGRHAPADQAFEAAAQGLLAAATSAAASAVADAAVPGARVDRLRAIAAHAAAVAAHLLRCIGIPGAPGRSAAASSAHARGAAAAAATPTTSTSTSSARVGSKRKLAPLETPTADSAGSTAAAAAAMPAAGYACLQRACAVVSRATRALVSAAVRLPHDSGAAAAAGACLLPIAVLIAALPAAMAVAFPVAGTAAAAAALRSCALTAVTQACEAVAEDACRGVSAGVSAGRSETERPLERLVRACTGLIAALGCEASSSESLAATRVAAVPAVLAHPALSLSLSLGSGSGSAEAAAARKGDAAGSSQCCPATGRAEAAVSAFDALIAPGPPKADVAGGAGGERALRCMWAAFRRASSAGAPPDALRRALACATPLAVAAVDCDAALPLLRLARTLATTSAAAASCRPAAEAMVALARLACAAQLGGRFTAALVFAEKAPSMRTDPIGSDEVVAATHAQSEPASLPGCNGESHGFMSLEDLESLLADSTPGAVSEHAVEATEATISALTQVLPHPSSAAAIKPQRRIRPQWRVDITSSPLLAL